MRHLASQEIDGCFGILAGRLNANQVALLDSERKQPIEAIRQRRADASRQIGNANFSLELRCELDEACSGAEVQSGGIDHQHVGAGSAPCPSSLPHAGNFERK